MGNTLNGEQTFNTMMNMHMQNKQKSTGEVPEIHQKLGILHHLLWFNVVIHHLLGY